MVVSRDCGGPPIYGQPRLDFRRVMLSVVELPMVVLSDCNGRPSTVVVSGLSCGGANVCTGVDLHLWLLGDENGCSGVVSAKSDLNDGSCEYRY